VTSVRHKPKIVKIQSAVFEKIAWTEGRTDRLTEGKSDNSMKKETPTELMKLTDPC
jgi:hypothetical protein